MPSHRSKYSMHSHNPSSHHARTPASRISTRRSSSSSTTNPGTTNRRSSIRRTSYRENASSSLSSARIADDDLRAGQPAIRTSHIENEDDDATLGRDDEQEEVFMAVDIQDRGAIGCAYYVSRTQTLHFMQDLSGTDPTIIEALKLFIEPSTILLPANTSSELKKCLDPEQYVTSRDPTGSWTPDGTGVPYVLQTRPSTEFGYEAAKHKLANLRIGQENGPEIAFTVPGDFVLSDDIAHADQSLAAHRHGQLLRLSAWIDIESRLTVGCAGAVLAYIQRRRGAAYLPGDRAANAMFRICRLQMFTLADSLLVNADALHSLQIISTESHPNAQQQGPSSKGWSSQGAKEGLSVYGLFSHQAKTPQGRALLRQYFLRPSMKLEIINERLDTISLLLRPENTEHLDQLLKNLAKIKNMRSVTARMRKGIGLGASTDRNFSSSTLARLRHFSYHVLCITDILQDLEDADVLLIVGRLQRIVNKQQLAEIGRLISSTIDIETSQEQHRTVIKSGVDSILDEARRAYEGLEDLLSRVAEHFANGIPSELQSDISVIFFPQIGFLVSVRLDPRTGTGVYEGLDEEAWERMFVAESNAYYKNAITTKLDEEYGDVYGKMCDREIELAQKLAEYILQSEDLINSVSDVCGELDCLTALAAGARQYGLVRPDVVDENVINIAGGRHILQELTVAAFIPNDTTLQGGNGAEPANPVSDSPSMIILTGPNYSGKSIYLKQVALITCMAHVGSFVPAESARIGLTDKILTRTATRETLSRDSSAFMTDLQQIAMALNMATRRSLLIIDEFGKGTDAADGAGLAAGVFEHLLGRGCEVPKVLAATHYHEIFEAGFMLPRPGLAFAHMEVRVDETAELVEQQITYLYTYNPGRSMQSFGTCCAALNGISPAVVARAERLILLSAKGCDLVEACTELPEDELAQLDAAEVIARRFLARDDMADPRTVMDELLATGSTEGEPQSTTTMTHLTL